MRDCVMELWITLLVTKVIKTKNFGDTHEIR